MEAFLAPSRPVNQYFGMYPGIVIDNVDPEKRYRVKVKFPWMMENDQKYVDVKDKEDMPSTWCRIASPMAGTVAHEGGLTDELRGSFFLPEVDDEVLVCFLFGSFREPVIIANLYNGKDQPFWQNKEDKGVQIAKKNNLRGWRSRSGHMGAFVDDGKDKAEKIVMQTLVCDDNVYDQPALGECKDVVEAKACGIGCGDTHKVDVPDGEKGTHVINIDMTDGKEHILISDKKGELIIKFDSVDQRMILYSEKDIVLHAKKNIVIKAEEQFIVQAGKEIAMETESTWDQKAKSTMNIKSDAEINEEGSKINMNC